MLGNEANLVKRWPPFVWIPLAYVLSRLLYLGVWYLWPGHGTTGELTVFDSFQRWDTSWYDQIATTGYGWPPLPSGLATWAFFPVYPSTVALVDTILPITSRVAALLVSNLSALAFLFILHAYAERRFTPSTARLWVLIYIVGPLSFYLSIEYSESVYMLLLVATLWAGLEKKWLLMGILGAILSATRLTGVFVLFYLAVSILFDKRDPAATPWSNLKSAVVQPTLWLGMLMIPAGLVIFSSYLGTLTGDPLAFLHVQRAWDERPLAAIWSGGIVQTLASAAVSGDLSGRIALLSVAFFLATTAFLAWKGYWAEAVFVACTILPSLTRNLRSNPRYGFTALFIFLAVALVLSKRKAAIVYPVVGLLGLVNLALVYRWFEVRS